MAGASAPDTSLSEGSEFLYDNVCQPCNSEGKIAEAEKICQDCCQHLCVQCTGFHKKLDFLKEHKLVASAEVNKHLKATFLTDIKIKSGLVSLFSSSNITGVALVPVERLVAADHENSRVMLIDTKNKKIISEFKTEYPPWDVTVCGAEVAATLIAKKIVFLRYDNGLVYVRDLRVHGRCTGIDYVDDKLYVVYDEEEKLEVMTVTGTVLQKYDKNDQGGPTVSFA